VRRTNTRIVAATNRSLSDTVARAQFAPTSIAQQWLAIRAVAPRCVDRQLFAVNARPTLRNRGCRF